MILNAFLAVAIWHNKPLTIYFLKTTLFLVPSTINR
jgi:hypothetical protein